LQSHNTKETNERGVKSSSKEEKKTTIHTQQVSHLQITTLFSKLLNRIASIPQNPLVTINVRNG
jgi:hypothetical protein